MSCNKSTIFYCNFRLNVRHTHTVCVRCRYVCYLENKRRIAYSIDMQAFECLYKSNEAWTKRCHTFNSICIWKAGNKGQNPKLKKQNEQTKKKQWQSNETEREEKERKKNCLIFQRLFFINHEQCAFYRFFLCDRLILLLFLIYSFVV